MKAEEIVKYLDEIIPNPRCELNYNKDYELLIATALSAQTTDKRVNEVTSVLFKKYQTLKDLKNADIENYSLFVLSDVAQYIFGKKMKFESLDEAKKFFQYQNN